ncbi:MAG: helix-turn-helix domain-containing protein [Actinomycetota bacterium]|nr:helix-turn-helix domain-containing protein [Actinomycetota bacterium]
MPESDRVILTSWANSTSIRAGLAQRARIVLLAADGARTAEIVQRTGASKPTVLNWTRRYAAEGLAGLDDRQRPGRPRTADDVAIVLATLTPPPPGLGARRWSSRLLAARMGVSNVKVAAVWREYGLRPWLSDGLSLRTDPALPADICAVVGLYLGPEARAVAVSRAPGARRAWPCAAESLAAALAAARPRTVGLSLDRFIEQVAGASPGGPVHVVVSGAGAGAEDTGAGPAGRPPVRRALAASPGIRLHAVPSPDAWLPLTEVLVGIAAGRSAGPPPQAAGPPGSTEPGPQGMNTPPPRQAARAVRARLADLDEARVPLSWIAPPPATRARTTGPVPPGTRAEIGGRAGSAGQARLTAPAGVSTPAAAQDRTAISRW